MTKVDWHDPPPVIGPDTWTLVGHKIGHKGKWIYHDGWTQKALWAATNIVTMQRRIGDRFELLAQVKTRAWRKVLGEE